eukprot:4869465-Amphidinium_carterae.1
MRLIQWYFTLARFFHLQQDEADQCALEKLLSSAREVPVNPTLWGANSDNKCSCQLAIFLLEVTQEPAVSIPALCACWFGSSRRKAHLPMPPPGT